MLNRTKTNNVLAKIRIILCLALTLMPFGMTSCRKDIFLRVDITQISIDIFDINVDIMWQGRWQTNLKYDWRNATADFGDPGYTKPELIKGIIYNVDPTTHKRYSSYYKMFGANGGRVSLNAGATYDMMFHNFGTETILFHPSDDFESFTVTATTRASNMESFVRTRAENINSEMEDTTKSYTNYNQPDELFGALVTGLEINQDPTVYRKEYDEDGNITYIYTINANLQPYSFIYLFQIIVLNNYDEQGVRVKGANGLTITGLSQGVDLFTRRTFGNTISISTDDVKPKRHMDQACLDTATVKLMYGDNWKSSRIVRESSRTDSVQINNFDIMASRVLTWGLPGMIPDLSPNPDSIDVSAPVKERNYIGVNLLLRNNYPHYETIDITRQMITHPAGGVITVVIDADPAKNPEMEKTINKKPQTTGGGFNASVENWTNEVNAEITI